MNIAIEAKKSEGAERLLQVTVPLDAVNDAKEKAARKIAGTVSLPGFRPGKAPLAMVMKRFGEAIRSEAVETLVQEAYKEVLEREQLKVAAQPHIHDLKFEEGEPLTFDLHLELRPELALTNTQGFKVTRTVRTVTDEDVQQQLEQLRDQRASWSPVEDKPMEGDMVTVLLATADEDGTIPEGREYRIVLGGGQAIPGIEEVIMSIKAGQSSEQSVRWPDDFPDETQRGKSKSVRVELKDVKRKSLPELDDAFASEVGDFESVEALRKVVREDMEESATRESDAEVRQKLLDELIGANPFDVPPSWVAQLVHGYADAYKIPEEEHERFATGFRPTAERQVRRDMVIDAIAESENLKASEADIDDKVTEMAGKRGVNPGQLYAQLQKAQRLSELERGITEDKVFAWLFERNTVE
ncbi:MAG: trigger factor [Gemmatimonadetes bacterium]|jgi:trigger factor|nr:trigger factor [Gemmatimonadota bacterium]MBK7834985.1 trigger factor [Gemmatimonadota bacterium]MBK8061399.1 trigger factor [Gemmatimonadota bacterium]